MATGTCYQYGKSGTSARIAWARELLKNPWHQLVYVRVLGEPEGGSEAMTGISPILGFEALAFFDSRATHSFISIMFIRLSRRIVQTLEPSLVETTPVGKTVICKHVV